ncbi:hypothetical protein ACH47B_06645 [Rhodococcus sp. NPDC019627]|uniref:hypothetical protein n=1 Tax=unclassified Rhodococcus (in: high G+C Gram-positive bacteria) TaxID=192944 RepID=UPI0037A62418
MSALHAPAREATKLVAGFMHFLADCLEETAGVEKEPAVPTFHIEHAVFHGNAADVTEAIRVELERNGTAGEPVRDDGRQRRARAKLGAMAHGIRGSW